MNSLYDFTLKFTLPPDPAAAPATLRSLHPTDYGTAAPARRRRRFHPRPLSGSRHLPRPRCSCCPRTPPRPN
ncbi:MAG: hypothetical protein MZV64_23630 [Ignavibacteriales bacterium]|nr:hypothetical protein [Ignavibacteriales bacterium]